MGSPELLEQLSYSKPYRDDRLKAGLWVIDNPEYMEEMVSLSVTSDHEYSMQALWSLEFVCRYKLELLYPYLDAIFNYLPNETDHSRLRALSFICELIAIAYYKNKDKVLGNAFTHSHKEVMTECCFDWMITQQKVACKVRAMTALSHLGTEFPWILDELEPMIKENIPDSSAGFQSRGKKVLNQIAKFRIKNQ